MSSALKKRAKKALDELSDERIKVAVDYLEYLKDKEEIEATLEIMSSPELMAQWEEAEKSLEEGRLDEFIAWEKVKRDV